ncbi:kinase-like protein [Gigaspora margarita]|uniref:Kinase-like protein n=1 Tax=Gigaspora margarita TaxID=4874 RepID=A0A8H3X898_GIGMA|nr:kinase-like protein [Gigaspora margarita]
MDSSIIDETIQEWQVNLYNYNEFTNIKLIDEGGFALEIARGIIHLHENQEKIVHRDLHSRNILVHDGKMMIADFGISKHVNKNQMITTRAVGGVPAYMEPKYLADHGYVRDEKSDVYSFGVLLWEISSCRLPFESCKSRDEVIFKIFKGIREEPVEGTPKEYVNLYTHCWDEEPNKRPNIQEVFEVLRHLQLKETNMGNPIQPQNEQYLIPDKLIKEPIQSIHLTKEPILILTPPSSPIVASPLSSIVTSPLNSNGSLLLSSKKTPPSSSTVTSPSSSNGSLNSKVTPPLNSNMTSPISSKTFTSDTQEKSNDLKETLLQGFLG